MSLPNTHPCITNCLFFPGADFCLYGFSYAALHSLHDIVFYAMVSCDCAHLMIGTQQHASVTSPHVPPDLFRSFLTWLCSNKHINDLACASLLMWRQRSETSEPKTQWGGSNKRPPEKSITAKPSQHVSTQPRH